MMLETKPPGLMEKGRAIALASFAGTVAGLATLVATVVGVTFLSATDLAAVWVRGEGRSWLGMTIGIPLGILLGVVTFAWAFRRIYRVQL